MCRFYKICIGLIRIITEKMRDGNWGVFTWGEDNRNLLCLWHWYLLGFSDDGKPRKTGCLKSETSTCCDEFPYSMERLSGQKTFKEVGEVEESPLEYYKEYIGHHSLNEKVCLPREVRGKLFQTTCYYDKTTKHKKNHSEL